MLTRFAVPPLFEVTRQLAAVASGRAAPDLVLTGARVLSVYSERMLPDREIWISQGRIAAVKAAGGFRKLSDAPARVVDIAGGILAPGLVDPHIHIESSMMTACAYAEAALLNGTTTIFCDSHEIGNVCDCAGVEWMLQDAREAPLNIFLTVPSTVPATHPGLETAGGDLTAEKVGAIFDQWPEAAALGEKMDFVPVALGDERSHAIIAESLKRGKPVCGHVYGREFVAAYAASGVTDTHEAIDREIANDFIEAGIWVFLRGGPPTTPWHSLPEAIKAVTELGASPKRVCVCTDDRDADDLFHFGQDWVTRQAVVAGMQKEVAWSMGSLHPADRYGMENELGGLGHSRRADIVLLDDDLNPRSTWYGGEQVVEDGKVTAALDEQLSGKRYAYPKAAYETVKLPEKAPLTPELPTAPCKLNVLGIEMPGIMTRHDCTELENTPADWPSLLTEQEACFLTVVERHGKNGNVAHTLLRDFKLKGGAVGSSVGHDAHNIILAGDNQADMQLALQTIEEDRGGIVVVAGGRVTGRVPLPVAGLLSDQRAPEVAAAMEDFKKAWNALGCAIPYMGFNLLPLSVIPELRLTDQGMVAVPAMELVPFSERL